VRHGQVRVQNPLRPHTVSAGPAHDPFTAWGDD